MHYRQRERQLLKQGLQLLKPVKPHLVLLMLRQPKQRQKQHRDLLKQHRQHLRLHKV